MGAIAAHLRYISKNGRLEIEDERGNAAQGRNALREIADDWRFGGTRIEEVSNRREAFNIMLSMPRGTDPLIVHRAAREFARQELVGHKLVMVLHDHQSNPHVHISVRAESWSGQRLNPRKADLQRWRETFAEKLRGWGVEAEATRQFARGQGRNYEALWRIKACEEGRLRGERSKVRRGKGAAASRSQAITAWAEIGKALVKTGDAMDLDLARSIASFLREMGLTPQKSLENVRTMKPQEQHQVEPRR